MSVLTMSQVPTMQFCIILHSQLLIGLKKWNFFMLSTKIFFIRVRFHLTVYLWNYDTKNLIIRPTCEGPNMLISLGFVLWSVLVYLLSSKEISSASPEKYFQNYNNCASIALSTNALDRTTLNIYLSYSFLSLTAIRRLFIRGAFCPCVPSVSSFWIKGQLLINSSVSVFLCSGAVSFTESDFISSVIVIDNTPSAKILTPFGFSSRSASLIRLFSTDSS